MTTILYSRDAIEHLVATWDSSLTLEDAIARTDLIRARATLPEQQRLALHYLCQGYKPSDIARELGLKPSEAKTLLRDTLSRLVEKMNHGTGASQ